MPDTLPFWLHSVGVVARRTPYFKGKWRVVDWLFRHWLRQTRWSEVIWINRQIRLKCDLWDEAQNPIWWCGTAYERKETRFLHTLLTPSMTFFDVGANIGYYSLTAAPLVGKGGAIHAFEPVSRQFAALCANIERNGFCNTTPNRLIVSDSCGEMRIHPGPEEHSGIASIAGVSRADQRAETVPSTTLDQYMRERKLPRIDVVKIDVEGHELHVLQGARQILQTHKPVLLIEVRAQHLERAGATREELFSLLRDLNYKPFEILANGTTRPLAAPKDDNLIVFRIQ